MVHLPKNTYCKDKGIILGGFMNIQRIFTPLFACIVVTTHYCNAFWPLPTKRDIVVASGAVAGTALLLHNYYLGQEQRIRVDIHTENDLTRSTVLTQGQETRSVVQIAGQEVVAAVEDTHADVRRVEAQTNTILSQNCDIASLLCLLFQSQSQIAQALGITEETSATLRTRSPQRQLPAPSHHPVHITALAAKMPCKHFEQLQRIPVQMQIRTQAPGDQTLSCPRHTFQAHGSTEDSSWGAFLKDIGNFLLSKK